MSGIKKIQAQNEFSQNVRLQWALGALIFCYFIAFTGWIGRSVVSVSQIEVSRQVCPVYFQSCDTFYFLHSLPTGYSQNILYMLLFGSLLLAVYFLAERKFRFVQYALAPSFLWHASVIFLLSKSLAGNYEYYVFVFGFILLLLQHKEFFLKLCIVLMYALSTVAKLHPAWIAGGYFVPLNLGLPLFPDWSIPLMTNLVILAEMVGAWFLLSSRPGLQRAALVFFVLFHLYSGILVSYRYPATILPMLLILFGPWYRFTKVPLDRRAIIGWLFVCVISIVQFLPLMIKGDEKLTLEGNMYGLYMFESNHQCISEAYVHYESGVIEEGLDIQSSARYRCDPYDIWFRLKLMCENRPSIQKITWTFDHSINGDPFLRIVDVEDACTLEYKPFRHNEWIKTHEDNPEIIGYPVKNYYY